jgi:opacity protein-like surface antigen
MKKIIIALIAAFTLTASVQAAQTNQPQPTEEQVRQAVQLLADAGVMTAGKVVVEHTNRATLRDYLVYFQAAGFALDIAAKMSVVATMIYATQQISECGTEAQQIAAAVAVAALGFYAGRLHSAWRVAKNTW